MEKFELKFLNQTYRGFYITDTSEIIEAYEGLYEFEGTFGLSLKTTGLDPIENSIEIISLYNPPTKEIFLLRTPFSILFFEKKKFISYNIDFIANFLKGWSKKPDLNCSYLLSKLLADKVYDGKFQGSCKLKDVVKVLFDFDMPDDKLNWIGKLGIKHYVQAGYSAIFPYKIAAKLVDKVTELGLMDEYKKQKEEILGRYFK